MSRGLLMGLGLLLSGCGTIQSLHSEKYHRNFKDGRHEEVSRTMGTADHLFYTLRTGAASADGVDFSIIQENVCPVRVEHKTLQRARRTGAAYLSPTGDPDTDIGFGIALDLLGGAALVSAASWSAHYNPNSTPASWSTSKALLWGGTAGVLAVDIAAYSRSVKKRTKMRYWHTEETKNCSDRVHLSSTADVALSVNMEDSKGGLISRGDGKFQIPGVLLGEVLLSRDRLRTTKPILWLVKVNQTPGPDQLLGEASFKNEVPTSAIKKHATTWRCAALGTDVGKARLASWDLQERRTVLEDLNAIECANVAVVHEGICAQSRADATMGRGRPHRTVAEINTYVDICDAKTGWSKVIGLDLSHALSKEDLDGFRRDIRLYTVIFGDDWATSWNKKAEPLVTKELSAVLSKQKNYRGIEAGVRYFRSEEGYLSARTQARLRATVGVSTATLVSRHLAKEDFSAARRAIRAGRPAAGDKWAEGQEKLVVAGIVRKEKREAAAVKWCQDNRFRILEKTPDWQKCMRDATSGPGMRERILADHDLFSYHMELASKKCVAQVGMSSTLARFERDCDCSDVDDFEVEFDNDYFDYYETFQACEIVEDDREQAEERADALAEADTEVGEDETQSERSCLQLEYKLNDKEYAYRDCMVIANKEDQMVRRFHRDRELYTHHMGLASTKCVARLGLASSLARFETGCSCSDVRDFSYEDADDTTHAPCDELEYARDEAEELREAREDVKDDPEARACLDLEVRVEGKKWAWLQCMVDAEWSQELVKYRGVEDLYEEMMRRKGHSCLDRVGVRSYMKRYAKKCGCDDEYGYEDRDGNDHAPCDKYAE